MGGHEAESPSTADNATPRRQAWRGRTAGPPMSAAFDGPYGIDGRTGCPEIGGHGYPDGVLFRAWEYRAGPPPVRTVTDRLGRPYALVRGYARVKSVLADPHTYRPDNALDAVTPVPVPALRV